MFKYSNMNVVFFLWRMATQNSECCCMVHQHAHSNGKKENSQQDIAFIWHLKMVINI